MNDNEYMLLGVNASLDTFDVLIVGTKEDCNMEFDVAIRDEETKANYDFLAVVKKIYTAELDYNVRAYREEDDPVAGATDNWSPEADGSYVAQGSNC